MHFAGKYWRRGVVGHNWKKDSSIQLKDLPLIGEKCDRASAAPLIVPCQITEAELASKELLGPAKELEKLSEL